jgi:hypothetical protein
MTYLIAGYIFVGVCYATASWRAFSSDSENKALIAAINMDKVLVRVLFVLLLAPLLVANALMWPFSLLTKLFSLLLRK